MEVLDLKNIVLLNYRIREQSTNETIYEVEFKANPVYEAGMNKIPITLYLVIDAETKEYDITDVSKIGCYENGFTWLEEADFINLKQKNRVIVLEKLLHEIQQKKDNMLGLLSTDEYTNMLHNTYIYNHARKAYNDYIINEFISEYDISTI